MIPKPLLAAWIVSMILLVSSSTLAAQDIPDVQITGDSVELNFQNAEIAVVLSALAELAGLNLMHGNLPDLRVTLRTGRPVPRTELRAYLEGIVSANGLALEVNGNLVTIEGPPDDRSGRRASQRGELEVPEAAPRIYVYRLRHAEAVQIAQTLGTVFGTASGSYGGQGLSRQGLSSDLTELRDPAPDGAGGAAEGMVADLPGSLEGAVRIVPDPPTNAILIHATPSDYAVVEAAIEQLDTRPLQVLIEVLIAEVRRDKIRAFGVGGTAENTNGPTTVIGSLVGLSTGDVALRVLNDGDLNVDAVLTAISQTSDVSIISRPVVIAQNNEEARILVGTQQPFVQLSRTLPTDGGVRDQVVQYRDVGTQLTIRPTINPDGYVSLTVLQEVSTATNEIQFDAPVIGTREVATRLLVRDGHTAVLGGLVQEGKEWSRSGIPILKDIPLLGALFGSTRSQEFSTELLLFLTPHVLRDDDEMDAATENARNVTPGLKRALPEWTPLFSPPAIQPEANADMP